MSGPEAPDSPPPEVPEEFAAAYSEAFRRALEEGQESVERPRWLVPALLSGLALVLVIGAYGVGRLLSGDDHPTANSPVHGTSSPTRDLSRSPSTTPSQPPVPGAWSGAVTPVIAAQPTASCTSPPAVDSAGHPVRYEVANTLDGDPSTAWRCDGSAVGEKLTFALPAGTELAQVGLIPGYAKIDPKSGADRYLENNRITRVRWTLAAGVSVIQTFDPADRAVQLLRVPKTSTELVTLEILQVQRGPRDTTAISEVSFAAAG